jgi:AbiV family abortive infection protein
MMPNLVHAPKISFRKLAALELECYRNGLQLHFDSILLMKARSYSSAFAISVIASEELGKGFGFAEMSFQAGFNKTFDAHDEMFWNKLLSDHKLKQGWFVSELFGRDRMSVLKRYTTIQVDKNNALYVGVRKGNHHIVRPFLIPASKARKQIGTVNEGLISLAEARLRDLDFDEDNLDLVFRRRRLLNRLKLAARTLK